MRVKEQMQEEREVAFREDVSFAEWLDYFSNEPTSQELDAMEQALQIKSTPLVSHPFNNTHYNTLQGA